MKIDGVSIGAVKSYTFENVTENHTIEVTFMKANGNPQTGVLVDTAADSCDADAADGANPVFGNLFELRSGGDASVGIADCGIVDPLADYTTILFHLFLFLFKVNGGVPAN